MDFATVFLEGRIRIRLISIWIVTLTRFILINTGGTSAKKYFLLYSTFMIYTFENKHIEVIQGQTVHKTALNREKEMQRDIGTNRKAHIGPKKRQMADRKKRNKKK